MKTIEIISNEIAEEIQEMTIYDKSRAAIIIKLKIDEMINKLMDEYSTEAEIQYVNQLQNIVKYRNGSPKYIEEGYKLSLIKHKKLAANRVANNLRKQDEYSLLKRFLIDNGGKKILDSFFESINQPIKSVKP